MDKMETGYIKQIRGILAFMAVILAAFLLKIGKDSVLPFAIAIFLFIMMNPLLNRLDKLKVPNVLSIIAAMGLVLILFLLIVYILFQMVNMLISKFDFYVARLSKLDVMISQHIAGLFDEDPGDFSLLNSLNIDWSGVVKGYLTSFFSKFLGILSDAMMVFVYLLFLLFERQSFMPKVMSILPRERGQKFSKLGMKMNRQVSKYVLLKTVISLITGVLFYLVALLTGLDFALVWGVLAFVLNFIPTIGSIIVTAGTILMAIIQFMGSWGTIIYIAIMMISIEMIVGNIIDPRLQGVQLNISPLVILLSLAIWGYLWGLVGMFLAVPLTSMLQIVCANIPSLKGVAVFLSTGKFLKKDYREESRKSNRRKKKIERLDAELPNFDVEMPVGHNPGSGMDQDEDPID